MHDSGQHLNIYIVKLHNTTVCILFSNEILQDERFKLNVSKGKFYMR
jgi:hypothetical protein